VAEFCCPYYLLFLNYRDPCCFTARINLDDDRLDDDRLDDDRLDDDRLDDDRLRRGFFDYFLFQNDDHRKAPQNSRFPCAE